MSLAALPAGVGSTTMVSPFSLASSREGVVVAQAILLCRRCGPRERLGVPRSPPYRARRGVPLVARSPRHLPGVVRDIHPGRRLVPLAACSACRLSSAAGIQMAVPSVGPPTTISFLLAIGH